MSDRSRLRNTATVSIDPGFGWRCVTAKDIRLWVKGYGKVQDTQWLAGSLSDLGPVPSVSKLSKTLLGLDGHFACVASGTSWTLAVVDRVRSIPLAFARGPRGWEIDDQAERLRKCIGLTDVNADAALALAMAGYTVDTATLYEGLEQLGPGEFVLFTGSNPPRRYRYYTYRPSRPDKPAYDEVKARRELCETTLSIIDGMMKSVGDRPLAVPLSAGRDSRLIVSAAHHLGYRNILTFSYGLPGNHEARTSRDIAERLGFPWRFVPTNTAFMRRHYASEDWSRYCRFADTLQSAPFVQDLPQIQVLKRDGYIPDDAVLCNGNSGDFISGNHIVPPMDEVPEGLSEEARLERIADTLYRKHFALWHALQTRANRERITGQIRASIARAGVWPGESANDYGVYEYAEFQDRQCKFVISGQRIYEFLGHDWRLPLWDNAYLDFFEKIPLEGKRGQKLYAEMLDNENWGGVWQGLPLNAKTVRPRWIRPLRWAGMLVNAPFGRESWHRFEKRYLGYWMELGSHSAIRPYSRVARDRRGARHGVSWLTEAYLNGHGLRFDGTSAI